MLGHEDMLTLGPTIYRIVIPGQRFFAVTNVGARRGFSRMNSRKLRQEESDEDSDELSDEDSDEEESSESESDDTADYARSSIRSVRVSTKSPQTMSLDDRPAIETNPVKSNPIAGAIAGLKAARAFKKLSRSRKRAEAEAERKQRPVRAVVNDSPEASIEIQPAMSHESKGANPPAFAKKLSSTIAVKRKSNGGFSWRKLADKRDLLAKMAREQQQAASADALQESEESEEQGTVSEKAQKWDVLKSKGLKSNLAAMSVLTKPSPAASSMIDSTTSEGEEVGGEDDHFAEEEHHHEIEDQLLEILEVQKEELREARRALKGGHDQVRDLLQALAEKDLALAKVERQLAEKDSIIELKDRKLREYEMPEMKATAANQDLVRQASLLLARMSSNMDRAASASSVLVPGRLSMPQKTK